MSGLLEAGRIADHPRERGEHEPARHGAGCDPGSSPRARGTPGPRERLRTRRRIIPASAGNTTFRSPARRRSTDHPRERGEHALGSCRQIRSCGSSPRARGTRELEYGFQKRFRIIPASAGNTVVAIVAPKAVTDHPRERGEHTAWNGTWSRTTGSSPRARGTLSRLRMRIDPLRIIPASAGNTFQGTRGKSRSSDHPRERGEHGRAGA